MGSNTTLSSKCRCRNCCSIAWAEDLPIHSACFRCSKKDRSRATLDEPSKVSIRLRFNVSGSTPDQLRFSLRRASHRPASSNLHLCVRHSNREICGPAHGAHSLHIKKGNQYPFSPHHHGVYFSNSNRAHIASGTSMFMHSFIISLSAERLPRAEPIHSFIPSVRYRSELATAERVYV